MEEFLVLLVQFVVEVLLDVLIWLPFEWPLNRNARTGGREGCGWLGLYLILGGAAGGVSLLIRPMLVLPSAPLRIANLLVSPVAAGAVSWTLARWRRSRGAAVDPNTHLGTAIVFVLAFGGVRLAYGGR